MTTNDRDTCANCGESRWLHKEYDYTGETEVVECDDFKMKEQDETRTR